MHRIVAAFAFTLLAVVLIYLIRIDPAPRARLASPPGSSSTPAPPAPTASSDPTLPDQSPIAAQLHAPEHDPAHDLRVVHELLFQFTTTLRLTERPPLGDNADITAALTGANRRRVVFVSPLHPAVRDGLLVDRRGTPYHFHARSADAIDVRGAGPDRRLFTDDDLVFP